MRKSSEQEETIKFILKQFQNLSKQTMGAVKEIAEHFEADSGETSRMEVGDKESNDKCY